MSLWQSEPEPAVRIRHADPARDGAACAAIYAPFVTDTAVTMEEDPPDDDEMRARIAGVTATYPWLVAERARTLAGYAYAVRHRERPAYRWAADVTVYVEPAHQRRRVGHALYGALLPLLARQGVRCVCAGITLPNPASVALHESFGFEPVGIYRRIAWKAGAWRDTGWWQRHLLGDTDAPPGEAPPAALTRRSR